MQRKRLRFFVRRSPKVLISAKSNRIIVPFKPASLVLIFLLILLSLYFALRSDIFQIRQVQFQENEMSQECVSKEKLAEKMDVVGRSVIFLDTDKIRHDLISGFICLKDVIITTSFPNRIAVSVKIRKPVAAVVATASAQIAGYATAAAGLISQEQVLLVDEEGTVVRKVATFSALPKIMVVSLEQNLDFAKLSPGQIKAGVEIIVSLSQFQLNVNQLIIDEQGQLTAEVEEGITVLFSAESDPTTQAASLQAILRQAKIDGKKLVKIDLRFDRPHVVVR